MRIRAGVLTLLIGVPSACGREPPPSTTPRRAEVTEECLNEPWAWLPRDPRVMRVGFNGGVVRRSPFAGRIATLLDRLGGSSGWLAFERIAMALHADARGVFVALRTDGRPVRAPDLQPLSERVYAHRTGVFAQTPPTPTCEGAGLAFALVELPTKGGPFESFARDLESRGLPPLSSARVRIDAEGDALTLSLRCEFAADMPAHAPTVVEWLRTSIEGELPLPSETALESHAVVIRAFARTSAEQEVLFAKIAAVFGA